MCGIMSDKTCVHVVKLVGNVNSLTMRTDRWTMKLLHGRLEVLYV